MGKEHLLEAGWANENEFSSYLKETADLEDQIRNKEKILAKARELLEAAQEQMSLLESQSHTAGNKLVNEIRNCANFITQLRRNMEELDRQQDYSSQNQKELIHTYIETKEFLEGFNPKTVQ